MLSISNITVDYGDGPILDQLSLTCNTGEVHGLVARNGEGKTTLLNTIYGILKPSGGQVEFEGKPLRSEQIAYLETEVYFYPMITGHEYLGIFRAANSTFDIDRWNRLFELPLSDYISTYSTGMQKKLALLAAFSLDRPVVLLDEPFNGLDLECNLILMRAIRLLADSGKLVIVTSHILESLESLCDRIHWLRGGAIEKTYDQTTAHELRTHLLADLEHEKLPLLEQLLR